MTSHGEAKRGRGRARAAKDGQALRAALQGGLRFQEAGNLDQADRLFRVAAAADPEHGEAHYLVGAVCLRRGATEDAAEWLARAVALEDGNAGYRARLGRALARLGRTAEAAECYERAIALGADDAETNTRYGAALAALGREADAQVRYETALARDPDFHEAHARMGDLLLRQHRVEAAIGRYEQALELAPGDNRTRNSLGEALLALGRTIEALSCFSRAASDLPGSGEAPMGLGGAPLERGEDAVAVFRRALDAHPGMARAHSNLLLALNHDPVISATAIFAESLRWSERFAQPLSALAEPHLNTPLPDRRLNLCYLWPGGAGASLACFVEPVLRAHDRDQFQISCYADGQAGSALARRLESAVDHWRDTAGVADQEVARLARADGIDLLIDLAGHGPGGRLLVFAERPAPVQISWCGYPGSTGLRAMDYRISDRWVDPRGTADQFYTEAVVRLANGFVCYGPPADAPRPAPPPSRAEGRITFGAFNGLAAVSETVAAVWAELLKSVPGARLRLFAPPLADGATRDWFAARLEALGVARDRLDLVGGTPDAAETMARYASVDIALDTFAMNGVASTCEALWMGVPVVTLAGERNASRIGLSLLQGLGLGDLVATSEEGYVECARTLAGDGERLAALRQELRGRMAGAALTDAAGFTGELEEAYRRMWRHWCAD